MLAYWVCAAITVVSAAVSFGFSVAALRGSDVAGRTASRYAFARSFALLVVAIVAPFTGSVAFVAATACSMVLVQAIDAVVGGLDRDRTKTVGPAVTAVVNAAALAWMLVS